MVSFGFTSCSVSQPRRRGQPISATCRQQCRAAEQDIAPIDALTIVNFLNVKG